MDYNSVAKKAFFARRYTKSKILASVAYHHIVPLVFGADVSPGEIFHALLFYVVVGA